MMKNMKLKVAALVCAIAVTGLPAVAQPPQNARVASVVTTCDAPAELYPSGNCGYAELSWAAVPGAVSYTVEYKRSSTATWLVAAAATTVNYLVIYGSNGRYDWRVKTNCAGGSSGYTTGLFFIFLPGSPACNNYKLTAGQLYGNTSQTGGTAAVSVTALNNGEAQLSVLNMNGAVLYSQQARLRQGANNVSLNAGALAPGLYQVQVVADGRVHRQKLVIR